MSHLSFEELTRRLENGGIFDPEVVQWINEFAEAVKGVVNAFKGLGDVLPKPTPPYRWRSKRHYRCNRAYRPGRRGA